MKILFIPDMRHSGPAERIPHLIRVLSTRHSLVGFPPISLKSPIQLLNRSFKLAERFYEPWKMARLSRNFSDVDLVFASHSRYVLPGILTSKKLGRPLIFDSHGNPELLCENINAGPAFRWRNIFSEKQLKGKVKRLITVSEIDKNAYVRMGFDEKIIRVVPVGINFDEVEQASKWEAREILKLNPNKPIILFFASYGYAPNMEAARYINEKLAPSIPHATVILAGRGKLHKKLHTNVNYVGFVDRIGLLINAADICIAPIWHGVGILQKVLVMMAYGKPTVVTTLAKCGIPELENDKNCIIASNRKEFIKKAMALVNDIEKCRFIGENAAKLIHQKYNWSLFEERLFDAVENT